MSYDLTAFPLGYKVCDKSRLKDMALKRQLLKIQMLFALKVMLITTP